MIDEAVFWEWLRKKMEKPSAPLEQQPQLEIEAPKRPPAEKSTDENKIDYHIDDNVIYKL